MLNVSITETNHEWVLDSSCNYHMCPNQEWFHSYNKIDSGQVLLSNNKACKVVGIGNVKIKLSDGTMKAVL